MIKVAADFQNHTLMDIKVETLQKLVQFNTISGSGVSSGSYTKCAGFLAERCSSIGLSVQQFELARGKPIVIATRRGQDRGLPSLLLTGHYDVVPCDMNKWTVQPFAGEIKDGKLYGRGTQDMKICLAAYMFVTSLSHS